MPGTKPDYDIIAFETAKQWRQWLDKNHEVLGGVWLRFYKKASGVQTVTYAEALDHALCYGWIDGQVKTLDELSYIQKFTPRRARSLWSKRNIEYIDRLTQSGLMMPTGQAEVDRAKADGRWDAAYDSPSEMVTPSDFLALLDQHPKAKELFETLNKTQRYHIAWHLQTAKKPETRLRRLQKFIAMLDAGEKP